MLILITLSLITVKDKNHQNRTGSEEKKMKKTREQSTHLMETSCNIDGLESVCGSIRPASCSDFKGPLEQVLFVFHKLLDSDALEIGYRLSLA